MLVKKWETPHLESIEVEKRTQAKGVIYDIELGPYTGLS